jgi:HK97 family phage major capsid protein
MGEPEPPGNGHGHGAPPPYWTGTDWYSTGVIPPQFSTTIIQGVRQQSAALQLGTRVPMGTSVTEWPIPKTFPKAGWVNAPGGRKPFTDLELTTESMKAEEIAAVIAIPNVMRDDSSINLWNYATPLLTEAIAIGLDEAVFFGEDAPPSFPVGGLAAAAASVAAGTDVLETVNNAMSAVELGGLPVTGHAADITVRGALRGMRDSDGNLLAGFDVQDRYTIPTLYGLPIAYVPFTQPDPDFFTGDWRYLFIGVRQDIRYEIDPGAVVADDQGRVVISGFQDNTTPMKVWARFACAIVKPVTPRAPGGANPFASATLVGADRSGLAAASASTAQASGGRSGGSSGGGGTATATRERRRTS